MMIVNFAHFSLKQNIFSGLQKDRGACIRENTVTQPLSVADPGEARPVCTPTPPTGPNSFIYVQIFPHWTSPPTPRWEALDLPLTVKLNCVNIVSRS